MNVFVAGATGVVGRPTVEALVGAGHDVRAVARGPEKAAWLRAHGAQPTEVDLFDPGAVKEAVAGSDVVVNLATNIPPVSKAARARAWSVNDRLRIEAASNLAEAAMAAGARQYVQESIAFAYPDHGDEWIDEQAPLLAEGFVASLADAERAARRVRESGAAAAVLRFGQLYAADASHTVDAWRLARRGIAPTVGHPSARWPAIHAVDAATAVVAAVDAGSSGVFNVCDDEPLTHAQAREVWAAAVGRRRLVAPPAALVKVTGASARHLLRSQRPTNATFRSATDWTPSHPSLREGLPAVVTEIATHHDERMS